MSVLNSLKLNQHDGEYTTERQLLVLTQVLWMVFLFGLMHLLDAFSFERYFVLSYLGFLVAVQLFAPAEPTPQWWTYVQLVVLLGFFGLAYFVVTRGVEIFSV